MGRERTRSSTTEVKGFADGAEAAVRNGQAGQEGQQLPHLRRSKGSSGSPFAGVLSVSCTQLSFFFFSCSFLSSAPRDESCRPPSLRYKTRTLHVRPISLSTPSIHLYLPSNLHSPSQLQHAQHRHFCLRPEGHHPQGSARSRLRDHQRRDQGPQQPPCRPAEGPQPRRGELSSSPLSLCSLADCLSLPLPSPGPRPNRRLRSLPHVRLALPFFPQALN